MGKLSRREFLVLTGEAIGLAIVSHPILNAISHKRNEDPTFGFEFDEDEEHLSFKESSEFARRCIKTREILPELKLSITQEDLVEWMLELVPMYQYEGATDKAKFPQVLEFFQATSGDEHNHVLGYSNCENSVHFNLRMSNPHSTWYGREDAIITIAHELAHDQQGKELCDFSPIELIENTAQIVALEVVSALANKGNKEAFCAVVTELGDMALSTAMGCADREGHPEWFKKLFDELYPDALHKSRFQASERHWTNKKPDRQDIIARYSEGPLVKISKARKSKVIEGLALPKQSILRNSLFYPPQDRIFPVDDVLYLIENQEALAKSFKEKK